MKTKIIIIGAGFAGLSAATTLAEEGYDVTILEKNEMAGGRARFFEDQGFRFDMGPSWYWMPDIFDNYFAKFGAKISDYFKLNRLDPSYKVIFDQEEEISLPANIENLREVFESLEKGSGQKLDEFLRQAQYKYEVGIGEFAWKPGLSVTEYFDKRVFTSIFKLDLLTSHAKHVRKFFTDEKILKIMEFPILFLGATPQNTPALYSLMNYAEICLGTWYPMGGMFEIVKAMQALAEERGVKIKFNEPVTKIEVKNGVVQKVFAEKQTYSGDIIIAGADYHHVEADLLRKSERNYSKTYWDNRSMSPSSLLFYLGINRKVDKLIHHNLFFDNDFNVHAYEIYTKPQWPSNPLFYVSAPSKTDDSVAPEGSENIFILMPIAPDLKDTEDMREQYYHLLMERLEKYVGHDLRSHVVVKRSYCVNDFKTDYHAFKGNAYGLANTLAQTGILKPSIKSKKIKNLFYTGQLTTPGPGVPPALISGQIVAKEVINHLQNL